MNLIVHCEEKDLFLSIYNKNKEEYKNYEFLLFHNKFVDYNAIYNYETSTEVLLNLPDSIVNGDYIEQAVLLRHSGDEESWQHFSQDCLPLIPPIINFLKCNKETKIILPKFSDYHSYYIRDVFELENEIFIIKNRNVNVKNLYIPVFTPTSRFIDSIVPSKFRTDIHELLSKRLNNKNNYKKYLTYVSRSNCNSRKVLNDKELINYLQSYAENNNLKFLIFYESNYGSLDAKMNIFFNSEICVIPHGGAVYHIYGCNPNTRIIEFISYNGTPICDIGKLAPYLLLEYNLLLVNGSHYGNGYNVNISKLDDILNKNKICVLKRENNLFNPF